MSKPTKIVSEKSWLLIPFFLGVALGIGIAIGIGLLYWYQAKMGKQAQQIAEVLKIIRENYVESINVDSLHQIALQSLLTHLDPHSTFIPADEVAIAQSQLETDFEGIGVEYEWLNDTFFINYPLPNSPAEKAGIQAGDKVISIDSEPITQKENSTEIFQKLRGKKGTSVKLTVFRDNQLQDFFIERNKVVNKSVVGYIEGKVAYIHILRFAEKTDQEFQELLQEFLQNHKQDTLLGIILDLRENGGGYMDKANKIADEFLEAGLLIVSTKGRQKRYTQEYRATAGGMYEKGSLVVLIDESSASASEILAGALQDNDRAVLVGRRSYGKGLVQMPFTLSDGSELRLTVSKYYTPSGRCIQHPYQKGGSYNKSLEDRYKTGWFLKDTVSNTNQFYKTLHGRTVFGEGGIVPDIAVPFDSTKYESKIKEFLQKTSLKTWIASYAQQNRDYLQKMGLVDFIAQWQIPQQLWLKATANWNFTPQEETYLKTQLKAFLSKIVWGKEGYYRTLNYKDEFIEKALQVLQKSQKTYK